MRVDWLIEDHDVRAVCEIVRVTNGRTFVKDRIQSNVSGAAPRFERAEFWRVMLGCLLTTQQRSGPGEPVNRFLTQRPFPLALADCLPQAVEAKARDILSRFGGIRFSPKIAQYAETNLRWLESGGWSQVEARFETLLVARTRPPSTSEVVAEREAASSVIDSPLKGFGPKQSRNLWQWLGLTRYEIPLDSRVTAWLNENNIFPFVLSAGALADRHYYELVLDGLQALCAAAEILPCVLDAAIFASYDREWDPTELDY